MVIIVSTAEAGPPLSAETRQDAKSCQVKTTRLRPVAPRSINRTVVDFDGLRLLELRLSALLAALQRRAFVIFPFCFLVGLKEATGHSKLSYFLQKARSGSNIGG